MLMSRSAVAFISRIASGLKSRSIRVRALDTDSSEREKTILSAPRQIDAKSAISGGSPISMSGDSQATSTSYIRRP